MVFFVYTFHNMGLQNEYTSGMGGWSDSLSRFLLECGTFFNGRKKMHMNFFVWGTGMNFPKGQDFSKRLKLMGPFFSL